MLLTHQQKNKYNSGLTKRRKIKCRRSRSRRTKTRKYKIMRRMRRVRKMRGGEENTMEECTICFDRPANCTIQHSDGNNSVPHRLCEQCWMTYSKGKSKDVCPTCRRQITSCIRDDGVVLEKAQIPVQMYRKNVLPSTGDLDEPCTVIVQPVGDVSEGRYQLIVDTMGNRPIFKVEFKWNRRSVHITKVECMDQANVFFELNEDEQVYRLNGSVISHEEGERLNAFIHSNFARAYPRLSQIIIKYIREKLGEVYDEGVERRDVPCDAGLFVV